MEIELYAIGTRATLNDGAHVAAPWCKATVQGDGVVTIDQAGKFEDVGVQGVKPVDKSLFDALEASEKVLVEVVRDRAIPTGETAATLRKGYCGWLKVNGVIGAQLAQRHPEFFEWLACAK